MPAYPSTSISFRHGQNPSRQIEGTVKYGERAETFARDQVWVDVPSDVVFEDVTDEVASEYRDISTGRRPDAGMYLPRRPLPPSPTTIVGPPTLRSVTSGSSTINDLLQQDMSPFTPACTTASPISSTPGSFREKFQIDRPLIGDAKLNDYNEAFLLRYFGNVIGPVVGPSPLQKASTPSF